MKQNPQNHVYFRKKLTKSLSLRQWKLTPAYEYDYLILWKNKRNTSWRTWDIVYMYVVCVKNEVKSIKTFYSLNVWIFLVLKMRPVQRRQQGLQYGIYLLAMQAFNFGIDKIPPVTLIGIIGQVSFSLHCKKNNSVELQKQL